MAITVTRTDERAEDPRRAAQSAANVSRAPRLPAIALAAALLLAAAPAFAVEPGRFFDVRALFERHDPAYRAERKAARAPLPGLTGRVRALEAAGSPAARCAQERLTELRTTLHDTDDFAAAAAEAAALERLLAAPGRETAPDGPDAEGAFGRCYAAWYLRLDASYDALSEIEGPPAVPARFLDRVATPEALAAYWRSLAVSDVAATGVDHRRELNISVADLMRLVLDGRPAGYPWPEGMRATVRHLLLDELRDPASGLWGARYRDGGETVFVPDLSITFHVVKYLGGDVPGWPKIVASLLAMRDLDYPQGWREGETYSAHDLYDVATLFRLGWPHADAEARTRMAAALGDMESWCLAQVVRPDGSVVVEPGDDSAETASYFAVGLLDELGAFTPARRYWTSREAPGGPALAAALAARIRDALARGGAEGGTYYRGALKRLDAATAP